MSNNSNPAATGKKKKSPPISHTLPITFSVPAEIANKGVYAAIFGESGIGGPQVFLQSQFGFISTATLTTTVTLPATPATTITVNSTANFPNRAGSLLLTQTDQYNNITAQTTVSYKGFDPATNTFSGISEGIGTFSASNTQVTLKLGWVLSDTIGASQPVPLLNLFPNPGSYTGTATAIVNLPDPGIASGGSIPTNSIYSGEIVIFVGENSGLLVNASQELVVPTLRSNPNDTFALFEWGLAGALIANSGGFIDYDVSAIDQVGFPFQVSASISSATGASTSPLPPFNNGVGFLQDRGTLFSGFTPYLSGLPSSSMATAFRCLAPENSLFAERITAPQDYLNFIVNSGPGFPQVPPNITGLQPIQISNGTNNFTFSVNPQSAIVQISGSGYTSAPTLTFDAPPKVGGKVVGTTATGVAIIGSGTTAGQVTGISITNVGSGYSSSPNITVGAPPPGGTQAAIAVGLMGEVFNYEITALRVIVSITSGGSGYTSAPAVTFTASENGGTNITGIAILGSGSTAGQVVGVYITNAGSGYSSAPAVTFSGGGGTGATAASSFIESMPGAPQPVQINSGNIAVLNWNPYPNATAYNIYRSVNTDMSDALLLNSTPYSPVALPAGTTLTGSANQSSTKVTVSAASLTTIPQVGTLLISQGVNESYFQYTSINSSTLSGQMFGTANFTAGASVTLLPNFMDSNSNPGTAVTPPVNNYNYEPLNQYFSAAIKDFFDYYRPSTIKGDTGNVFSIDIAGSVSTKWTGQTIDLTIDGNIYTVLQLTGEKGQYGSNYVGDTANIYQPFFTSNVDPKAFPSLTLPPPPSWLTNPFESPASMVFGADGVFGIPDNTNNPPNAPYSTAPAAIVKDIMNPIDAAINRGLTPRFAGGTWVNTISPDYWSQAPLFPLTAAVAQTGGKLPNATYYYAITGVNVNGDTSNQETIPGNIVTVLAAELGASATNTVTLTIPNTGATTFSAFNIYRGVSPGSLMKIGKATPVAGAATTYTDEGNTTPAGAPPFIMNAPGQAVNWYAAYLHQLTVSINGLAYGTPYDDQGSFSSNVNLTYSEPTPQPAQGLTITLLPW